MSTEQPRRGAGKKPRWTTAQKKARQVDRRAASRPVRGADAAAPRSGHPRARPGSSGTTASGARGQGRPPAWRDTPGRDWAPAGGRGEFDSKRGTGSDRNGTVRPERSDRSDRYQRPERQDRYGRPERQDRYARPERDGRTDRPARDARSGRRSAEPGRAQPRRGEEPLISTWGRDEQPSRYQPKDRPSRGQGSAAGRPRRRDDRQDAPVPDRFERPRWGAPAPSPTADRGKRMYPERRRPDAGRRPDHHAAALLRRETPVRYGEPVDRPSDAPEIPRVGADNGFLAAGVPRVLAQQLAVQGITEPFPIQAATLPDALAGRDILGRGQTGSGKTLAYGLPILARLAAGERSGPRRPRALVLVPTRELAIQVDEAIAPLAGVIGIRHRLVAGGLSYQPQITALDRGVDLLIATPGRMIDLVEKQAADLSDVEIAVLDEADHMAEMGFVPEVTTLLDQIPEGGQRLLFSATLDRGVDAIVARYLKDSVTHSTDAATASVTTMEHHVFLVEPPHKKLITADIANRGGRTLVFVRTKLGADRVAEQLRDQGVFAAALHGGLNQNARNRVLAAFREGQLPVLVATDVAARGIHVDDVGLVLQVDPPADHKDYLHRAGRTARAGDRGIVVTLALPHQQRLMKRLAQDAGVQVTPAKVGPGDEALTTATGARRPDRPPVPEDRIRRLMAPEPSRRRPPAHRRGLVARTPRA